MTASVPAVVDVSVLVAGLISKRGGRLAATVSLIDLWWAGAIEPVVCPTLIGEFEATLRKNKIARIIPPAMSMSSRSTRRATGCGPPCWPTMPPR